MNSMRQSNVGYDDLPTRWEAKEKHFDNVYNRYYWKIYQVCRRYSSKPDDAEDLTHDVFVQYFLNFEKFRNEASPSTWMYRVAVNLGIHRWRRDRTQFLDDKEMESIPAHTRDNENHLLAKITLKKILDRCPELTRKILSLFHIEGMTQMEICELLGISRSTVTRHLIHVKRGQPR